MAEHRDEKRQLSAIDRLRQMQGMEIIEPEPSISEEPLVQSEDLPEQEEKEMLEASDDDAGEEAERSGEESPAELAAGAGQTSEDTEEVPTEPNVRSEQISGEVEEISAESIDQSEEPLEQEVENQGHQEIYSEVVSSQEAGGLEQAVELEQTEDPEQTADPEQAVELEPAEDLEPAEAAEQIPEGMAGWAEELPLQAEAWADEEMDKKPEDIIPERGANRPEDYRELEKILEAAQAEEIDQAIQETKDLPEDSNAESIEGANLENTEDASKAQATEKASQQALLAAAVEHAESAQSDQIGTPALQAEEAAGSADAVHQGQQDPVRLETQGGSKAKGLKQKGRKSRKEAASNITFAKKAAMKKASAKKAAKKQERMQKRAVKRKEKMQQKEDKKRERLQQKTEKKREKVHKKTVKRPEKIQKKSGKKPALLPVILLVFLAFAVLVLLLVIAIRKFGNGDNVGTPLQQASSSTASASLNANDTTANSEKGGDAAKKKDASAEEASKAAGGAEVVKANLAAMKEACSKIAKADQAGDMAAIRKEIGDKTFIGNAKALTKQLGTAVSVRTDQGSVGVYEKGSDIYIYAGHYKNGVRNGKAAWYSLQGDTFYQAEGSWKEDMPQGTWKITAQGPAKETILWDGTMEDGFFDGEVSITIFSSNGSPNGNPNGTADGNANEISNGKKKVYTAKASGGRFASREVTSEGRVTYAESRDGQTLSFSAEEAGRSAGLPGFGNLPAIQ